MAYIVDKIKEIIDSKEYSYKDIAVILRTHRSKKPIEQAFVKAGYPYTIADGLKFYAKSEVRIALAYIRMLLHSDNESFALTVNVPSRRVGEVLLKRVEDTADKNLCDFYEALKILQSSNDPAFSRTQADEYIDVIEFMRSHVGKVTLSTLVSDVLRMSGYLRYLREGANEEKINNVEDLIDSVRLLEERRQQSVSLEEYIELINEFTREADEDEEKDEIQIMTMHSSKGLEFKVVFLPLFNDGNIPSSKSTSDPSKLEEERRLAYVAFTRAEDLLVISDSEGLSERGKDKKPSRFLFDFDRNQLDEPNPLSEKQVEDFRAFYGREKIIQETSQADDIQVGSRVEHPVFGVGTVKAIDTKNYLITFESLPTDRTIGKHVPIKLLGKEVSTEIDKPEISCFGMGDSQYLEIFTLGKNNKSHSLEPKEDNVAEGFILPPIEVYEAEAWIESDREDREVDLSYYYAETEQGISKGLKKPAPEPISDKAQTQVKTVVEHPIWGKGFISQIHESHIAVRFPEINETRLLPNNTISIRKL